MRNPQLLWTNCPRSHHTQLSHPQLLIHPISLWPLHPTQQLAWLDIYWCWHTAICTCTCSSCWYQNHKGPKSTDVSDDAIPFSAQGCCKSVLTETFAEAILEKQSIVALIPLGNEETKLPIMTKLYFLPEKLWHRIRKLVFAAYPQKHLRLPLLSEKKKKKNQSHRKRICAQCNLLPFREHKMRSQNTVCTTIF